MTIYVALLHSWFGKLYPCDGNSDCTLPTGDAAMPVRYCKSVSQLQKADIRGGAVPVRSGLLQAYFFGLSKNPSYGGDKSIDIPKGWDLFPSSKRSWEISQSPFRDGPKGP